ncbi:MAG: hypothetical protein II563_01400, partial [Treponema sp.]|nr:hypothetical protein [Treponema sp.]
YLNVNIHRGVTIWKALPGFVAYEKMKYGAYLEHVNVDVQIKRIKTTRLLISNVNFQKKTNPEVMGNLQKHLLLK